MRELGKLVETTIEFAFRKRRRQLVTVSLGKGSELLTIPLRKSFSALGKFIEKSFPVFRGFRDGPHGVERSERRDTGVVALEHGVQVVPEVQGYRGKVKGISFLHGRFE
ncbi:hypothetical protein D3C86_1188630 [compost metagenome]